MRKTPCAAGCCGPKLSTMFCTFLFFSFRASSPAVNKLNISRSYTGPATHPQDKDKSLWPLTFGPLMHSQKASHLHPQFIVLAVHVRIHNRFETFQLYNIYCKRCAPCRQGGTGTDMGVAGGPKGSKKCTFASNAFSFYNF